MSSFRKPLVQGRGSFWSSGGHMKISSRGLRTVSGQEKWNSIILPYINQTVSFFFSLCCPWAATKE